MSPFVAVLGGWGGRVEEWIERGKKSLSLPATFCSILQPQNVTNLKGSCYAVLLFQVYLFSPIFCLDLKCTKSLSSRPTAKCEIFQEG